MVETAVVNTSAEPGCDGGLGSKTALVTGVYVGTSKEGLDPNQLRVKI